LPCSAAAIGLRQGCVGLSQGWRHIGSLVERLVRESIRPELVAARRYVAPKSAVTAFDGGASARKAVAFLADSSLAEGMTLDLVTVGTLDVSRRPASDAARAAPLDSVGHELRGD